MKAEKGDFLEHIAGLRGVAILLVLLFHLNAQAWPQGYVGVDVFLVISGYLLIRSRANRKEPESLKGTLSYLGRRVQRILPPMTLLIILTLLVGAILLQPEDEIFASRVGYQACLIKANEYLAHEMSNYFAADTAFNPLLHLWYLSVALQVYLIYAVVNQATQRLPRVWGASVAALVGMISLLVFMARETSYYATLPRLWEVAAGGLVCVLPGGTAKRRWWATVAAGMGLLAILLPGLGLVPASRSAVVAGTVAALRYLPLSHTPRLLSFNLLQWIGRISFSLYLVHLPIIVFWRLWDLGSLSIWGQVGSCAAALLLGWGFWWTVEKRRFPWWMVLLVWIGAMMLCRAARKSEGFVRYVPLPSVTWTRYENWQVCRENELYADWPSLINPYWQVFHFMNKRQITPETPLLTMGDPAGKATCLLMGDSHAMCLYAGLNDALRQEGPHYTGAYLGSIVLPFSGWQYKKDADYYFNPPKEEALLKWLASRPKIRSVIISVRWGLWYPQVPEFEERLRRFLQELKAAGKQVLLVGPMPEYSKNNTLHYQRIAVLRGMSLNDISPVCSPEQYSKTNRHILPILRRLEEEGLCTFIDLLRGLRPGEAFPASLDEESLMVDTNHLSPAGSIRLVRQLLPQLRRVLNTNP